MGCSSVQFSVQFSVQSSSSQTLPLCWFARKWTTDAQRHTRDGFFLLLLLVRAQFGMKFALEISEEVHRSAPRISRRKSGTQDLDVAAFFWVCFASFLARGVGIDCVLVMHQLLPLLLFLSLLSLLLPTVFFFTERV